MVTLDHVNLNVKNLEESLSWYQNLFAFKVVEKANHKGKPYAIIQSGQSMLCLYQEEAAGLPTDSDHYKVYHFGLRVENQQQWLETIKKYNVEVDLEWDYPHSKSWYVSDPTGHEIEVCYWHNNKIQFDPMPAN